MMVSTYNNGMVAVDVGGKKVWEEEGEEDREIRLKKYFQFFILKDKIFF